MSYSVCVSFYTFFCLLAIFQVLQCTFLICYFFNCFSPHFIFYHVSFSFSSFVGFLAIFQVLKCEFLIFLFVEFYHHNPGPTVCISHFSHFSLFSPIPSHTVFVSYFPRFSFFFPQSSSYSVYFSYLKFFTVSYHFPGPTVCVSHFIFFFHFLLGI